MIYRRCKDKPLISIIVAIYNIEQYLDECIQSIINQTYDNLEIILVDDGSTDGSGTICDKYIEKDSRIRVVHKPNGGLSDARNAGIELANGSYIGFVDGDDTIHPQMYEILMGALLLTRTRIAACGFWRDDKDAPSSCIKKWKLANKVKLITGSQALIDIWKPNVVAWNKLYDKTIFDTVRYPVGRLHEDEFVIHRILRQCSKIAIINCQLYHYRNREGSIISELNEKRIEDALAALKDRIEYAVEERWEEVLVPVIERYCDYCIEYYCIVRNDMGIENRDSIMNTLRETEKKTVEEYKIYNLNEKYISFFHSSGAEREKTQVD